MTKEKKKLAYGKNLDVRNNTHFPQIKIITDTLL